MSQDLYFINQPKAISTVDIIKPLDETKQLPVNKLAELFGIQDVNVTKMHSKASVGAIANPKIPSTVTTWDQLKKTLIDSQLKDLLAELQAMVIAAKEGGGDYPIAFVIFVAIGILATLSTQLKELTAKPLEAYQEINTKQEIVRQKIEAIKKKQLAFPEQVTQEDYDRLNEAIARGDHVAAAKIAAEIARKLELHPITEDDVKGLQKALKELDEAVEKLRAKYTFENNDGDMITIFPDEVKDIYDKARANTDMMLNEKIPGTVKTLRDDLDSRDIAVAAKALSNWAKGANDEKPKGAFVEWDNGKNGSQGNSVMKIILDTEISTYTDRLNKEAQLVSTAQSMGAKGVENFNSLVRGIVANYQSR